MRWYQVFECDNTKSNPLVCDSDNLEDYHLSDWDFQEGREITDWSGDVYVKATSQEDDGDADDALQTHLMIPIFSSALVLKLVEHRIGGIQFLPLRVIRPNGEFLEGFQIANLLNFVFAFDYKKSRYNRFRDDFPNENVRGKIMGVMEFVLLASKLEGLDIIRLAEYRQSFFVSGRFKTIFEENHFTGYSFAPVRTE